MENNIEKRIKVLRKQIKKYKFLISFEDCHLQENPLQAQRLKELQKLEDEYQEFKNKFPEYFI